MGSKAPYPMLRSGQDLRVHRQQLLQRIRQDAAQQSVDGSKGVTPGTAE